MRGGINIAAGLVMNLCLLLALGCAYGMASRRMAPWPRRTREWVTGGVFGLLGLASMLFPVEVQEGVLVDFRTLVVSLSGVFAGVLGTLSAGLLVAAARAALGGPGLLTALAALATAAYLGNLFRPRQKPPQDLPSASSLLLLGLCLGVSHLGWSSTLPEQSSMPIMLALGPWALLGFPLATMVMGRLLAREIRQHRTEEALHVAHQYLTDATFALERHTAVLEHAVEGIARLSQDGRMLEVNPALSALFGKPAQALVGLPVAELFPEAEQAQLDHAMDEANEHGRAVLECVAHHEGGAPIPLEITLLTTSASALRPAQRYLFAQNLSERKATAEFQHLALHDALTGLPNRRALMERLTHEIHALRRRMAALGVFVIDVDDLKGIHHDFGRAAGDSVLRDVGKRLLRAVRPGDTLARLESDELVLVAPSVDSEERARTIIDRLRGELTAPFHVGQTPVSVSLSIGAVIEQSPSASPEELLERADRAMLEARRVRHSTVR